MDKTKIGIILISFGVAYGSLAFAPVNRTLLGYLLAKGWLKVPATKNKNEPPDIFGPRLQIFFYSFCLIGIGLYIIFNPHI